MPEEVVYVLGTPGSNTVKIGRTTNLTKRFAEIQRMSPVPLAILWTTPGGHELETQLHRNFTRLRSHGEWFTFRLDPVKLIKWAVEGQPWLRPKVSLRKASPKVRRVRTVPAPRVSLAQMAHSRHPHIDERRRDVMRAVTAMPDLVEQYREIERLQARLKQDFRQVRQEAVLELKAEGRSWREVGEVLGVSGARAEQMSRGAR